MATLVTRLFTKLHGEKVGEDAFGNIYYRSKRAKDIKTERRWVVYKGIEDGSKVPAEWHGWMHKTNDTPPSEPQRYPWQKPHLPNLTGTPYAYLPDGHLLNGGKRAKATGDYESWIPPTA
jgi:NADH:ubiquinone oxidoreductase subunit